MSLLPHLLGYSWFLSLFVRLLGPSPLLAPALNVILSTLSCGLIFAIYRRLWGLQVTAAVCLLWILFPSQTISNIFTLSEPSNLITS